MYCTNCGATATGKYCSHCGRRILDDLGEFRRIEKATRKQFVNRYYTKLDNLCMLHLAEACWMACEFKYGLNMPFNGRKPTGEWIFDPLAYERLATVNEHAIRLCDRLVAADDF